MKEKAKTSKESNNHVFDRLHEALAAIRKQRVRTRPATPSANGEMSDKM